jgi:hypothetical protein
MGRKVEEGRGKVDARRAGSRLVAPLFLREPQDERWTARSVVE